MLASGQAPQAKPPKRQRTIIDDAVSLRWSGFKCLGPDGKREKLPSDFKRHEAMVNKDTERRAELEEDIAHFGDPFQTYGFGLVAYRETIYKLAVTFIIFSVLSFPILWTYRSGSALTTDKDGWGTLGNLGYNSVRCKNSLMAMGVFQLQCPYGMIHQLTHFGVNPTSVPAARDACQAHADFGNVEASGESALDGKKIRTWFETYCMDRSECAARFDLPNSIKNDDPGS